MTLEEAVDVFVRGFAQVRSRTAPYLVDSVGSVYVLHDPNGVRHPRRAEVVGIDIGPEEVMRALESCPQANWCVSAVSGQGEQLLDRISHFKLAGYRLIMHEPIFWTSASCEVATDERVRRVATLEEAKSVAKYNRALSLPVSAIGDDDANWRTFCAWSGAEPMGWVSSIRTDERSSWVANLFVRPEFRRHGVGEALMRFLLADDFSRGLSRSVLASSRLGARLYPRVGYLQLGLLAILSPRKG